MNTRFSVHLTDQLVTLAIALFIVHGITFGAPVKPRILESVHNLLVDAKVAGNLKSFHKGLRGAANHMIYDIRKKEFLVSSQWHEYGVGYGQDLGIVSEDKPAFWMARWPETVRANLIVLSGVYGNQPQPKTAWKIELRRNNKWITFARGVGGWYDGGRYVWGGPTTSPIEFDALRVSTFSSDKKTPIKSMLFRGERGLSWVVAYCPPIDAKLKQPDWHIRVGQPVSFEAVKQLGDIRSWKWDFADRKIGTGRKLTHVFKKPGSYKVRLFFSDGTHTGRISQVVTVLPPIEARITPLTGPVMAGKPVKFTADTSLGVIRNYSWDFGDGRIAHTKNISHVFAEPGIFKVKLVVSDGEYSNEGMMIVRVHSADTIYVPQVILDTDQKNEQDDQHYLGYALFSELDILGVNSIHHGGGQEPVNYKEILNIIDLAGQSGLPEDRKPFVFHGANERLEVPESGRWFDTVPVVSEASEGILSAARGASPGNPVWVVPVGPGTNVASAILQARVEGLDLNRRMRVMWLGGSKNGIADDFNGGNDPWSIYCLCRSGIETWILPATVGARVRIDKRTEADYYADNPLGRYLLKIVPAHNKSLYDPACLSAIISMRLKLGWVKEINRHVVLGGPSEGYRWKKTGRTTSVRLILRIDQQKMKEDIFNTMKGKKKKLVGAANGN